MAAKIIENKQGGAAAPTYFEEIKFLKIEKTNSFARDSIGFLIVLDGLAYASNLADNEPQEASHELPVLCSHLAELRAFEGQEIYPYMDRKFCQPVSSDM